MQLFAVRKHHKAGSSVLNRNSGGWVCFFGGFGSKIRPFVCHFEDSNHGVNESLLLGSFLGNSSQSLLNFSCIGKVSAFYSVFPSCTNSQDNQHAKGRRNTWSTVVEVSVHNWVPLLLLGLWEVWHHGISMCKGKTVYLMVRGCSTLWGHGPSEPRLTSRPFIG